MLFFVIRATEDLMANRGPKETKEKRGTGYVVISLESGEVSGFIRIKGSLRLLKNLRASLHVPFLCSGTQCDAFGHALHLLCVCWATLRMTLVKPH